MPPGWISKPTKERVTEHGRYLLISNFEMIYF
jgi:hypothetical protein